MILVHKPISALPTGHHHRRLPSAPAAVVVQPTRTPGLLNLIPRVTPPRLSQQPRAKNQNKAKPLQRSPERAMVADKSPRGRKDNKPAKEKPVKRSASLSSTQAQSRRQPRQASPLRPVETGTTPPPFNGQRPVNSNTFDPFLASASETESSDTNKSTTRKNTPKAVPFRAPQLSKPSGKLAHRRHQVPDSPTPARAIPVPRPKGKVSPFGLSRSAPVNPAVVRPPPKRIQSDRAANMFPICDDMTDIDGDHSRPSTPARKPATWQQKSLIDDGPRTAPLSTAMHSFPFNFDTPSPSPAPVRERPHARVSSESVFNMTFDEESASSSDTSEELKALFAGMMTHKRRMNKSREDITHSEAEKAAYFASSQFQNSPSPDDLPDPAFML